MIICGFAGVGKSYIAKRYPSWVDLESTPFKKNWDLYTDVAMHMDKNGYNVMLSCHKDVREMLKQKNAEFIVVLPNIKDKNEYIRRYKERGNTNDFIKLFEDSFEKFHSEITEDKDLNILLMERGSYLGYYVNFILSNKQYLINPNLNV